MKKTFIYSTALTNSLLDDLFNDDFILRNKTDFIDKDNKFLLVYQVPGLGKEDISVKVEEDRLIIEGENDDDYSSKLRRIYKIPNGIKVNDITAEVSNGILKVNLPKEKPKQVKITVE